MTQQVKIDSRIHDILFGIDRHISASDRQIDRLAYERYGNSAREIRIVDGDSAS